jgi:hypothetical protein
LKILFAEFKKATKIVPNLGGTANTSLLVRREREKKRRGRVGEEEEDKG